MKYAWKKLIPILRTNIKKVDTELYPSVSFHAVCNKKTLTGGAIHVFK
jgi:hypothetical protein